PIAGDPGLGRAVRRPDERPQLRGPRRHRGPVLTGSITTVGTIRRVSSAASWLRSSARATSGKTTTETRPAATRAAAVTGVMRWSDTPMAVAATTNGGGVGGRRPAAPAAPGA